MSYGIVHNAAAVVPMATANPEVYTDTAIVFQDETVIAVGGNEDICREYPPADAAIEINASMKTVLPGFVDPHTHAVFAGNRSDEFAQKLQGKTYRDIMDDGGGILRTVEAVRRCTPSDLVEKLTSRFDAMLTHGTTTVEVKSGYGLNVEAELKLLRAVKKAAAMHPITVMTTFMGAHAVPKNTTTEAYVDNVINAQLPAVVDAELATFCDVFCESDVFSVNQSQKVLEAASAVGLTPKIHAEEFERIGGTQLAASVDAASADHLLQATPTDADALSETVTTPVLLPGTAFTLDTAYADPTLFDEVAIATDFNPNCHSLSMEFAVDLACHGMRMSPLRALQAATRTAAQALNLTDGTGCLATGTPADIIIADVTRPREIPYSFGVQTVDSVIKSGEVITNE